MNTVRNSVSGTVSGSVVQVDSVGSLHITSHHHGHVSPAMPTPGVAAEDTVIQIAGQTFSGWAEAAAAYPKRRTADHEAFVTEDDSEHAPEPDDDAHAECWGVHPGSFGPADCDGREF